MNLLFIDKVKLNQSAFAEKVVHIAKLLGIDPNWLMFVMNSESGLNHQAKNPYAGAIGLIQFMPATAKGLGTSVEALAKMTNVQQLDYVYKYYLTYKSRIKNITDLYLATFYPYAMGKPDSYQIGSEKGLKYAQLVAKQNPIFDLNKDGIVTLGEWKQWLLKSLKKKVTEEQYNLFFCPNPGLAPLD
jgi:hypothetical protein